MCWTRSAGSLCFIYLPSPLPRLFFHFSALISRPRFLHPQHALAILVPDLAQWGPSTTMVFCQQRQNGYWFSACSLAGSKFIRSCCSLSLKPGNDKPGHLFMALLRIIRPLNCLIAFFSVGVGMFSAVQPVASISLLRLLAAALAAFLVAAFGNVVNDIQDTAIDAVNRPDRPIPSGAISG